jgi:hypothetical protein
LPLRRVRWTVEHAIQGLSWQGIAIVGGFSAIYGLNPRSGGVPELAEAARGMAAGMMLFVPAYVLAVVAAQFAPRQIVPRALVLTLVAVAGIAVGYALAATAFEGELSWRGSGAKHATMVLPVVLTVLLGLAILILHERERAAAQAVHDEMERKLDLERRMSEARLKALQSQIEPHFLFNSLAHVRRLCRTDAPAGRGMLRHLAHYIGAAQPALMHAGIPLADDADLAVAYLNIQQIRMGERLRFDVDLPRGARAVRVPPMTLTTLAENAIKHGLSPLEDGGEIRIAARAQGEAVVVDVADSGQGFQSTLGAGVGLANTRARLAMLHGAAASLELTMNSPRGVIATLVLPRESSSICAP